MDSFRFFIFSLSFCAGLHFMSNAKTVRVTDIDTGIDLRYA